MSLILEALKKSEAERQLGRAPGLMTPMPGRHVRRSGAWTGAIVGLAIAGMVSGMLWFGSGRSDPDTTARPAATSAPTPSASAMTDPTPLPPPPDPTAVAAKPATPEPTRPAPAEPAAPGPRPTIDDTPLPAPVPRDPEFESIERESIALAARIPPPPVASRAPSPLPGTTHSVPATAMDPATTAAEALPRFDQLMPDVRDALPPLKQSMHVFAQVEADRFVLIDGRRYRQGESIAPSLTIVAIHRDGTELDFDGRRFLLPRP
jgi:general secretion pathway protein B